MTRRQGMLLGLILTACAALLFGAAARTMTVQVRRAPLRSRPSFLGRKLATLPYGAQVTVLRTRRAWAEVVDGARRRGWVHRSALTTERISMRAGQRTVARTTTGDELALATKGFDEQVERSLRTKKPNLNYRWVEWMERITVSADTMERFLREGRLVPQEGGWR